LAAYECPHANGQNIFRRGTQDCAVLDVDGKPVYDLLVKTETQ
jgi:hypothetical protein